MFTGPASWLARHLEEELVERMVAARQAVEAQAEIGRVNDVPARHQHRTFNCMIELAHGKLVEYPGNYEKFLQLRAERLEKMERRLDRLFPDTQSGAR